MLGGPVSPETGWILYDPEGVPQPSTGRTIAVGQRIACSASLELLERIARGDGPDTLRDDSSVTPVGAKANSRAR